MEDTILEQQQSFSQKLAKIQQANIQLTELENKMNLHFRDNERRIDQVDHIYASNEYDVFDKVKHTEKRIEQPEPRYTNITHKAFDSGIHKIYRHTDSNEVLGNIKDHQKVLLTQDCQKNKKRQNFKIFPKTKSQKNESIPTISNHNYNNLQPQINIERSYMVPEQPVFLNKNHDNQNRSGKPKNHFVHQLQSMEKLMKEKIEAKENKLRYLEQQIINENQERVYLYKVNVRLEEELKFLQTQQASKKTNENPVLSFQIKKLESDIEKLKDQIGKKKKQKKQLLREQKTLKEGYRVVVNNCKELADRQFEKYSAIHFKEKNAQANEKMLKKLVGDLEKLKNLAEQRVKDTSNKAQKRRVIRSYKS